MVVVNWNKRMKAKCFHTGQAAFFCLSIGSVKKVTKVQAKEPVNLTSSPTTKGDKF